VVGAPAGAGALLTGTSTAGSYVSIACPGGDSAWNVQITGLTSGTLYFETSLDSTNGINGQWIAVNGRQTGVVNTVLGNSATANGVYRGNTSGAVYFRVRSVGALTGTPAIVIRVSSGIGAIFLNASIPAGTNKLGTITRTIDGSRTLFAATFNSTNAAAADTIISTLVTNKGATQLTAQTSVPVTSGKILRITSILVGLRTTTAALPYGVLTLRINHSGAAVIGSPMAYQVPVSGNAATAGNTGTTVASIEDGLELSGTMQFALSFLNNVNTNVTTVTILGYEYTA
jgi:hypothetical protein